MTARGGQVALSAIYAPRTGRDAREWRESGAAGRIAAPHSCSLARAPPPTTVASTQSSKNGCSPLQSVAGWEVKNPQRRGRPRSSGSLRAGNTRSIRGWWRRR